MHGGGIKPPSPSPLGGTWVYSKLTLIFQIEKDWRKIAAGTHSKSIHMNTPIFNPLTVFPYVLGSNVILATAVPVKISAEIVEVVPSLCGEPLTLLATQLRSVDHTRALSPVVLNGCGGKRAPTESSGGRAPHTSGKGRESHPSAVLRHSARTPCQTQNQWTTEVLLWTFLLRPATSGQRWASELRLGPLFGQILNLLPKLVVLGNINETWSIP